MRACARCGADLSGLEREYRFQLPDPVFDRRDTPEVRDRWGGDDMMLVQGLGGFVRVRVEIPVEAWGSWGYGAWLAVRPEDLRRIWAVWDEPAYDDLVVDGFLANALPPWGRRVLAAPCRAQVRDRDQLPVVVSTQHPVLAEALSREQPHDQWLEVVQRLQG